jgi:hypothetical protein
VADWNSSAPDRVGVSIFATSRSMVSPGRSCSTLVGVVVMPIEYNDPPDENAPGLVVFATFTVDPVVPVTVT